MLTFGRHWGIGDLNVEILINTAEIIYGLPFVRMEHAVQYKKLRANEKDLSHLDALKNYRIPHPEAN